MGERSDSMNSDELKNFIENARINKDLSQRELARISGISRSTLNNIINGKIKKVNVDSLKRIAETLDLSLEKLLKIARYDEFLDFLSLDRFKDKSTEDLKKLIEKYKESELDLLNFDLQKRKVTRNIKKELKVTIKNLKEVEETKASSHLIGAAIKNIRFVIGELKKLEEKYNYEKLPKE